MTGPFGKPEVHDPGLEQHPGGNGRKRGQEEPEEHTPATLEEAFTARFTQELADAKAQPPSEYRQALAKHLEESAETVRIHEEATRPRRRKTFDGSAA